MIAAADGREHAAERGQDGAGRALQHLGELLLGAGELVGEVEAEVEPLEERALARLAQEPGRLLDELLALRRRRAGSA